MRRLRYVVLGAFLFLPFSFVGCGEDQPTASTKPGETKEDQIKNTVDMMKKANTGMDPKAVKKTGAAPAK